MTRIKRTKTNAATLIHNRCDARYPCYPVTPWFHPGTPAKPTSKREIVVVAEYLVGNTLLLRTVVVNCFWLSATLRWTIYG